MFAQIFRFDVGANILYPALPDPANLMAPVAFGPNLTILRGQSLGRQTANGLMYPYAKAASDGTQTWCGFNIYSGATDANGVFYKTVGGTAAATFFDVGIETGSMYTSGVFDPANVYTTAQTGTPTAEVDTFTPAGSITTGDINYINLPNNTQVTFTTGGTTTATAVANGLRAAWAANPYAVALGTTSGTATFIVTGVTPGNALGLTSGVVGTGTLTRVQTTAPSGGVTTEVDTFTPAGSITVGDVYTLTITYPNLTTASVSYTAGTSPSATTVSGGLIAAWNANGATANYATATGTATVILTSTVPANLMNVAGSVVGVGTISKATTTPAYGRSLADIQISKPGAYILQPYGYWRV